MPSSRATARGVRTAPRPEEGLSSNTRSTPPTSCAGCSVPPSGSAPALGRCSATTSRTWRRSLVEHASGVVGTILSVFNGVRGREERRFEVFFERGAVEATTDFIVGATEDSFLIQRPDTAPERPDLAVMREHHFAELGLPRRDFVFYTYPADRHWVHCVDDDVPAAPGFDDALRAHELVDAAYRSAAAGSTVAP